MEPETWFGTSDKVVLVDAKGMHAEFWASLPVEKQIYCVAETKWFPDEKHQGIKLVGIHEARPGWNVGWFHAGRFCLVQGANNTDHQVKTVILSKQKGGN